MNYGFKKKLKRELKILLQESGLLTTLLYLLLAFIKTIKNGKRKVTRSDWLLAAGSQSLQYGRQRTPHGILSQHSHPLQDVTRKRVLSAIGDHSGGSLGSCAPLGHRQAVHVCSQHHVCSLLSFSHWNTAYGEARGGPATRGPGCSWVITKPCENTLIL